MPMIVDACRESWPIAGDFTIARGSKVTAELVVATISDGEYEGLGECVPYGRYGESVEATLTQIETFAREHHEPSREQLLRALAPGAARNALDCALWDLQARREGRPVWELAGLAQPQPVATAYTITIDTPANMQANAEQQAHRPLLKVKLGGGADLDLRRLRAVRRGAPTARLIIDVNEGWSFEELRQVAPVAADIGVELIEQPLAADSDAALAHFQSPVPIGADESFHTEADLKEVAARYQVVNIKLDKTGGLTAALAVQRQAEECGLAVMIGCMVATSLAMAPALLLAQTARFVDLDGPLLLKRDREPGLVYDGGSVAYPGVPFWGNPAARDSRST